MVDDALSVRVTFISYVIVGSIPLIVVFTPVPLKSYADSDIVFGVPHDVAVAFLYATTRDRVFLLLTGAILPLTVTVMLLVPAASVLTSVLTSVIAGYS